MIYLLIALAVAIVAYEYGEDVENKLFLSICVGLTWPVTALLLFIIACAIIFEVAKKAVEEDESKTDDADGASHE